MNDHNDEEENELVPSIQRRQLAPTPTPSLTSADIRSESSYILRLLLLKAISTQISTASERIHAGTATSLTVSQMIAVGMSHGQVLAFDNGQTLKWCSQDFLNDGAASCLAFNDDDTRLLVGYARGEFY